MVYQNAYHFIQPFYTTTESFLRIVRVPEILPCGKMQQVKVDYKIDPRDLMHGSKHMTFSYYVSLYESAGVEGRGMMGEVLDHTKQGQLWQWQS